jgi:hypothetical protein
MRLRVVGTEDSLPLKIVNRTPGVIDIEGKVTHIVNTAGGADNFVTKNVRGIHKGNFNIEYSLNQDLCRAGPDNKP